MFTDINISVMVEKELDEKRVPIPLVIEKTNQKSAAEITAEIEAAKNQSLAEGDIVLNKERYKDVKGTYFTPYTEMEIVRINPKTITTKKW